mgnify:CR=1 FL=1
MRFKAKHQGILSTLALAGAVLAGCASQPQFTGQSVTDSLLRKDVFTTVERLFSAVTQCRSIQSVDASVASVEPSATGTIQKAVESWQVSGCGTSKTFKVLMTADDRGETNFSVSPQG